MTTYVALLRAVNLGAHNKVGMRDLCNVLTDLGMEDVRSLLQSGNVVFRSDVPTAACAGCEISRRWRVMVREKRRD